MDEAQELTDAEWQMLLLRCPSRSFTVVGDRPGQARVHRVVAGTPQASGYNEINLASLTINYRTPEEVMAEAEPVIRAALPDANVPTSIRSTGVPVLHGPAADLEEILDAWLAKHAEGEGIACVIGDPTFPATSRVRSLTPELAKGSSSTWSSSSTRSRSVTASRERSPLCSHDKGDPATCHPHERQSREASMNGHAVVIAGGGPTGLMLAGELALAGTNVAIVERRTSQVLAGSRARGLYSRTIEVLDQRGIADRFLSEGQVHPVVAFVIRLNISDFPTRHPYTLALGQDQFERIRSAGSASWGCRSTADLR